MYVITTEGCSDGWGKPLAFAENKEDIVTFSKKRIIKSFSEDTISDITVSFKDGDHGAKWRIAVEANGPDCRCGIDMEVFDVSNVKEYEGD